MVNGRQEGTHCLPIYNDCIAVCQPHKMCVMRFDSMCVCACVWTSIIIDWNALAKPTIAKTHSANGGTDSQLHTYNICATAFSLVHFINFLCYLIPFYWLFPHLQCPHTWAQAEFDDILIIISCAILLLISSLVAHQHKCKRLHTHTSF